jgi:hypothetical protein
MVVSAFERRVGARRSLLLEKEEPGEKIILEEGAVEKFFCAD